MRAAVGVGVGGGDDTVVAAVVVVVVVVAVVREAVLAAVLAVVLAEDDDVSSRFPACAEGRRLGIWGAVCGSGAGACRWRGACLPCAVQRDRRVCARIEELQLEVRRRSALLHEVDAGVGVGGARGGGLDAQREEDEGAGQRAPTFLILRAGCGSTYLLRRWPARIFGH